VTALDVNAGYVKEKKITFLIRSTMYCTLYVTFFLLFNPKKWTAYGFDSSAKDSFFLLHISKETFNVQLAFVDLLYTICVHSFFIQK
ncbi:MAG: hypothetical protein ACI90V_009235, partial [Bacillariaceae sp.]|jgi:hypothetical protein